MTQNLSVNLPSDTIYVSGTVNGISATWTNIHSNTWESIVERAADNKYTVELQIINSIGSTSSQSFVLYYGLNLITDRTQEDVNYALYLSTKKWDDMTEDEKVSWVSLKGAYNASDLNRVAAAVNFIKDRLQENGYTFEISTKTDWLVSDVPTSAQLEQYLQNILSLKEKFTVKPDTPPLPSSMENLDYVKANHIEKVLVDFDFLISEMENACFYSGEIFGGEI